MKKLMALSLAMLMTLSLAACGSGSSDVSEDGTFTPTKTITWTCTSSAGGGSDIFSRKISEIMTNEDMVNGQTIVVSNETDGAGEVGRNKIAPDYDAALWRARNIAGPLNARRLAKKTPCAVGELKCHNCKSPDRICAALVVLWEKPALAGQVEVVLINEEIGF